jgi:hypothetical protein
MRKILPQLRSKVVKVGSTFGQFDDIVSVTAE